jgi:hypothetical protein
MVDRISMVKVFSATKAKARETLGERVTEWISSHPRVVPRQEVIRAVCSPTVGMTGQAGWPR